MQRSTGFLHSPKPAVKQVSMLALLILFISSGSPVHADQCTVNRDTVCAIGPASGPKFDRCFGSNPLSPQRTMVGNQACDALLNVNSLGIKLQAGASRHASSAKADIDALVTTTLRGAINEEAASKYRRASQFVGRIQTKLDRFVEDEDCGSEASMRKIQQFFSDQGKNLVAGFSIATSSANSVRQLQPALPAALIMVNELNEIGKKIDKRNPDAMRQFEKLAGAIGEIVKNLNEANDLDFHGAASAGFNVVTELGPYLTSCAACAAGLIDAAKNLTIGTTTGTGGAVSCPETASLWGGGCWGIAGYTLTGIGTVEATATTGVCGLATAGTTRMYTYVTTIASFVQKAGKLANGLSENSSAAIRASTALVALAENFARDASKNVRRVQEQLEIVANAVDNATDQFIGEVIPAAEGLTYTLLEQTSKNIQILDRCFKHLQGFTTALTGEVVSALADFTVATATFIEGDRVLANLLNASNDAKIAADRVVARDWRNIRDRRNRLYRKMWGLDYPSVNPVFTATHLLGLALNPGRVAELLEQTTSLLNREANLTVRAFNAGKTAFLSSASNVNTARQKFTLAGNKSQSALSKFESAPTSAGRIVQAKKFAPLKPRFKPVKNPRANSSIAKLKNRIVAARPALDLPTKGVVVRLPVKTQPTQSPTSADKAAPSKALARPRMKELDTKGRQLVKKPRIKG